MPEDSECLFNCRFFLHITKGFACSQAKKQFNVSGLSSLSNAAKVDLARTMHFDYKATNGQIRRILRLDSQVVEAMFPSAV